MKTNQYIGSVISGLSQVKHKNRKLFLTTHVVKVKHLIDDALKLSKHTNDPISTIINEINITTLRTVYKTLKKELKHLEH